MKLEKQDMDKIVAVAAARYFTQQGWKHMRFLKIEVVVGAVKIGGHYRKECGSILTVIAFTHLHPGDLFYACVFCGVWACCRRS